MAKSLLFWDWGEQADLASLREALAPFGVRVYDDPGSGESGSFGFVLSDEDLSEEELRLASEELWGPVKSVPPA